MTFKQALKKLGIEKYENRILNSNSHGELFHCHDYILIAQAIKEGRENEAKESFSKWFDGVVKKAEENWTRPESIFQHISKLI